MLSFMLLGKHDMVFIVVIQALLKSFLQCNIILHIITLLNAVLLLSAKLV